MTRYIIVALLLTTSLLAQTFNVSTTPELRTVLTIAIQNVLAGVETIALSTLQLVPTL